MAGPVNTVVDSFTRANESPIAAPWVPWYPSAAMPVLTSNQMTFPSGGGWAAYDEIVDRDQECFYTITALVSSRTFMLGVRFAGLNSSSLTGYWYEVNTATGVGAIRRMVNTSSSDMGATFTQAVAAGDSLRLWAADDVIGVDYKAAAGAWTELATRTDGSPMLVDGYTVAGGSDTGLALDNFGYGALGNVAPLQLRSGAAWAPANVMLRSSGTWAPAAVKTRSSGAWV